MSDEIPRWLRTWDPSRMKPERQMAWQGLLNLLSTGEMVPVSVYRDLCAGIGVGLREPDNFLYNAKRLGLLTSVGWGKNRVIQGTGRTFRVQEQPCRAVGCEEFQSLPYCRTHWFNLSPAERAAFKGDEWPK